MRHKEREHSPPDVCKVVTKVGEDGKVLKTCDRVGTVATVSYDELCNSNKEWYSTSLS